MKKSFISFLAAILLIMASSCNWDVDVTGVSISMTETKIFVDGPPLVLWYTISPSNATNQSVTWRSSEPSVATVNQDGVVLAVSPGTAIITIATRDGDRKDHCTVTIEYPTVNVAVSSVALNVAQASIEVGGNLLILTHTITPSNATNRNVTWRSSAENVATVNADGIVTPISTGVTIITVETRDGNRQAHCTVTVTASQPPKSDACEIISFVHITKEWGITGNEITATYPEGTVLTSVAPTITVSQGATVNPPSLALQDFSDGKTVTYTVTAEDGVTQKTYIASATVEVVLSDQCDIISFTDEDNDVEWIIDDWARTITAVYPEGTDVTAIVTVIVVSEGATVNPASGTQSNFSQPVFYTVTAQNGTTTKEYRAQISFESNP